MSKDKDFSLFKLNMYCIVFFLCCLFPFESIREKMEK